MRLGIVLTDDRLAPHAAGLAEAAVRRGGELRLVLTDRGVTALGDDRMGRLLGETSVQAAVCELSVDRYADEIPAGCLEAGDIIVGGQYQDAELVRHCARTVVL